MRFWKKRGSRSREFVDDVEARMIREALELERKRRVKGLGRV